MKTNEQHSDVIRQQGVIETENTVNTSRRNFAKSGLAVSGVLLTLSSRSAMAVVNCKSPSGNASANKSAPGGAILCSGQLPSYWKLNTTTWPASYLKGTCTTAPTCNLTTSWTGGTLFNSVFNCSLNGSIYNGLTMMQVMWMPLGADPSSLGDHMVAALLNASSGLTPVLTQLQVIAIFNEWNLTGVYHPTAGVTWSAAQIVSYLQSTMG